MKPFDAQVLNAIAGGATNRTAIAEALNSDNGQVGAALTRLRLRKAIHNTTGIKARPVWAVTNGHGAPPQTRPALTIQATPPADLEFAAAIDHRSRIAIRSGGTGIQITPADALELLDFLLCQQEPIKAAAKAARGGKR